MREISLCSAKINSHCFKFMNYNKNVYIASFITKIFQEVHLDQELFVERLQHGIKRNMKAKGKMCPLTESTHIEEENKLRTLMSRHSKRSSHFY